MDYKDDKVWLMQGDAVERMREIPTGSVDLIFADIPYGMTANDWDIIIPFLGMWEQIHRITKIDAAICLMAASPFDKLLGASNIKELKYEWIWQKNKSSGHLNVNKRPMRNHENILIFYRKQPIYNSQKTKGHKMSNSANRSSIGSNYGKAGLTSYKTSTQRHPLTILPIPVINNDGSGEEKIHPTQKPIQLPEHFIKTYSNEGDTVCDFTMGRGGTVEAAVKLNRKVIGIDNGKCEKEGHKYFNMNWTDIVYRDLRERVL